MFQILLIFLALDFYSPSLFFPCHQSSYPPAEQWQIGCIFFLLYFATALPGQPCPIHLVTSNIHILYPTSYLFVYFFFVYLISSFSRGTPILFFYRFFFVFRAYIPANQPCNVVILYCFFVQCSCNDNVIFHEAVTLLVYK